MRTVADSVHAVRSVAEKRRDREISHELGEDADLEDIALCFMWWDQIAAEMNYSRRWVLKRLDHALSLVERLMSGKEEMA